MIIPSLPFTLRQLEVFSTLAISGSFRGCAEQLGISQASVSNQLKALEDQLAVTLFDRKPGRRPLLTAEGRAFESDLREFYAAAQRLAAHRAARRSADTTIQFRLLVGQGMFDFYIRQKLDSFFAQNPQIELEFETRPPTSDVPSLLQAGRFDFALINIREDLGTPDGLQPLARVRGGIYGHRSFAEGERLPLSPEQVSLLPFVLPHAGSRQERELLAALARADVRPRKVVGHSQYYDVMGAMLERGVAVASFSEPLLRPETREQVVQLMPLVDWRMWLFCKPASPDPRRDVVKSFLIDATIGDPDFPAAEVFA
ncbi:LysR family transcriptional regulator [Aurantiacibacter hainanensis]|uniref:LysR family transcriptional regulator n=1 Tax=Aurantiacibacter hainanensis TaxID=3076114 RepID=UPI0030C776BE